MKSARFVGALCAVAVSSPVVAAGPVCEGPRIRDTGPLQTAIAQDRAVAQAFQRAATDCAQAGAACEKARSDCSALLATTLKAQVEFDEGWWLRDIMMSYLGQSYPMSRPIAIGSPLTDVTCELEVEQLTAAGMRRAQQAERRQAIFNEYPKYARWANEAFQRCKEQAAAEEQRSAQAKAEAERLAAAAAAAKAAEDDRRRKAEEEARRQREAQEEQVRKQREAQVEAERKQKAAQEKAEREAKQREEEAREREAQAQRKAEEEAEKRADAEKRAQREAERQREEAEEKARDAQEAQELKARREKEEMEEKARRAEEARVVAEREQRKEALRQQRAALIAEAEAAAENDTEEAKERRKTLLLQIDAEEEKIRDANARRIEEAKRKAASIAIPEEDERSRGAVGITGGAGYGGLGGATGVEDSFQGVFAGAQVLAHLGIWGVAPAAGMASGFEVRAAVQFSQAVSGGAAQSIEGHLSGRYFFGPLGVGVGGEFRLFNSTLSGNARPSQFFGVGPAIGVAMIDNPSTRVSLNVQWLPVGSAPVDLARGVGDLEVSSGYFSFDIIGGTLTDPKSPARFGFYGMATVGVRLGL